MYEDYDDVVHITLFSSVWFPEADVPRALQFWQGVLQGIVDHTSTFDLTFKTARRSPDNRHVFLDIISKRLSEFRQTVLSE